MFNYMFKCIQIRQIYLKKHVNNKYKECKLFLNKYRFQLINYHKTIFIFCFKKRFLEIFMSFSNLKIEENRKTVSFYTNKISFNHADTEN